MSTPKTKAAPVVRFETAYRAIDSMKYTGQMMENFVPSSEQETYTIRRELLDIRSAAEDLISKCDFYRSSIKPTDFLK